MRCPRYRVATCLLLLLAGMARAASGLGDVPMLGARQGWGTLQVDRSVSGKALRVGGREDARGLGMHAPGEATFLLDGRYERFEAIVGVDDAMREFGKSSVVFKVLGDGRTLFDSGVMGNGSAPRRVSVDVTGVRELSLVVSDGGDGMHGDHADWVEPALVAAKEAAAGRTYEVGTDAIGVRVSDEGVVVGVRLGDEAERPVRARTWLGGGSVLGGTTVRQIEGGGVEVERAMEAGAESRRCRVTERFRPAGDSVRWEVEVRGTGSPWTTPIMTVLWWPQAERASVWAAWQDPVELHAGRNQDDTTMPWNDPLEPRPFASRTWTYGVAPAGEFWRGDIVTLPMVTVMDRAADRALSLVQSPEDVLIEGSLTTSSGGGMVWSRTAHRIGEAGVVRFSMDLVAHPADFRGGLGWMARRYPAYFDPPNPRADEIAGLGAYSGDERALDAASAARLRRMGFRALWKLGDDYASMGMFVPPVRDADERWDRVDDTLSPKDYKPPWTSARRLNDHARMLQGHGFHLLSYFNVTEFGRDMREVPGAVNGDDPELWRRPSEYLKARMPDAPLRTWGGGPRTAWQNGWVTDPGDPAYQAFLLEQAERLVEWVPASPGICIDRSDYLRLHNPYADDGATWHDGRAARSLVVSWRSFAGRLAAVFHRHGKVVFCNLMHPRIDLARDVDGLYAEFGNQPPVLNGNAVLCVRKPLMVWTRSEDPLGDAFFQRHLYLGAFPTAPYPANNHCIQPSPERDPWYLDYGPLFDALRGRKWVLVPRAVSVVDGGTAKVNVFRVRNGYVVPVTFAADRGVRLRLRGLEDVRPGDLARVLHPGTDAVAEAAVSDADGGTLLLDVPVRRGCAMVILGSDAVRQD